MVSRAEINSSIYGAWRVAFIDPAALRYFNVTIEGFWHSFVAIPITLVLVLPQFVFDHAAALREGAETVSVELFTTVKVATFLAVWMVFPVAMIWISRLLRLTDRYVQFIIVWNWGNVVGSAFMLPAAALHGFAFPTEGMAGTILLMFVLALLYYGVQVARAGLACGLGTAVGILIFEFVLHMLIDALARTVT